MGVNSNGTTMMDQGVFENLGSVTWDTTAKTAGFTAVSGNGYFVNTTSGAITVTLPATPSAGDIVGIKDYANTADTNAITIGRNGSNINGDAANYKITIEGLSAVLVYVDATKGWLITNASQASDITGPSFVAATGGTVSCCGDYKTHIFTGPGTFTVTCAGNPLGSNSIDYLVVAGGGGGGTRGGGGAGGLRIISCSPVTVTGYPVTVGGGGTASPTGQGGKGNPSTFSPTTSAGGGGGINSGTPSCGSGGSGGGNTSDGTSTPITGGVGNTPPVSPPQGNPGGSGSVNPGFAVASGGGGATAAGTNIAMSGGTYVSGPGGAGTNVSPTFGPGLPNSGIYAGGGGGGADSRQTSTAGTGGPGGGGNGGKNPTPATAGTTNTGGGGGGSGAFPAVPAAGGGSGIVIIRYKYQ